MLIMESEADPPARALTRTRTVWGDLCLDAKHVRRGCGYGDVSSICITTVVPCSCLVSTWCRRVGCLSSFVVVGRLTFLSQSAFHFLENN